MLRFVWQKIRNKKWLFLSLLIGNLLLVAVSAATPMYTRASLQRLLTRNMSDYVRERNAYPTTIYICSSKEGGQELYEKDASLVNSLGNRLGVEPTMVIRNRYLIGEIFTPELERSGNIKYTVRLGAMDEMKDHVTIVSGSLFADEPDQDGVYDVIVSESCLDEMGAMRGEVLTAQDSFAPDGSPLKVRISGVFRADSSCPEYWYQPPSFYRNQFFLSEKAYDTAVPGEKKTDAERIMWFWTFDYNDLTVENCAAAARVSGTLGNKFTGTYRSYSDRFSPLVKQYLVEADRVRMTLLILQVPLYVLLAVFIFMVSRQMLEIEASEIAVIKSRGASRGQILGIYALQSALLAGVSFVGGIPLAMMVCQIIGSSNAFLEFVSRTALTLVITPESLLYGLAAAVLGMAAMVLPVLGYSRTTIVSNKQEKARKRRSPLWKKLFLDVLLIAVSLYGVYVFRDQADQISERVREGAGLNPLIYLASSLFIVGCGIFALRLIPLLVRLIYRIGRKRWPPSLYASYLGIMRSGGGGYIMAFLVVTIALGIFSASVARTVNSNETDRIVYVDGGADVVLMEKWKDNKGLSDWKKAEVEALAPGSTEKDPTESSTVYIEPDFLKYTGISGMESVTRVICDEKARSTLRGRQFPTTVTLMGIHTKEFGETAWLKDGLLPEHFNAYLNAMSQKSDAVLVSSQFRDKYGYQLGDVVQYSNGDGKNAHGLICGFVDLWPAYTPVTDSTDFMGKTEKVEHLLVVANYSYLVAQWGVVPYQVWMKMADGDTSPVYDFVKEEQLTLTMFRDQSADLIAMKNSPDIQGTNGILTVGFVVALVLCTVGFLIYWILDIRSRALQFGVFRAMGMSMREIVVLLLNEQFYVSGLSIAMGAGAGILASRLFVPLVQLAYRREETPLPMEISLAGSDVIRLLAAVLIVAAVCTGILWTIVRRLKIDQALKLGED